MSVSGKLAAGEYRITGAEDAMMALATVCSDIGCTVDEFSRSLE